MKVRVEIYNFGKKKSEFERTANSVYAAREIVNDLLADLGYAGDSFTWGSKIKVGPFVSVKFNVYK